MIKVLYGVIIALMVLIVFLCVQMLYMENRYKAQISETQYWVEFYRDEYHKYYNLSEELQNQMGVYYDY